MSRNFNLPPGTLASDLDPQDVRPRCDGCGAVEKPKWTDINDSEMTCPDCGVLGVVNLRVG